MASSSDEEGVPGKGTEGARKQERGETIAIADGGQYLAASFYGNKKMQRGGLQTVCRFRELGQARSFQGGSKR